MTQCDDARERLGQWEERVVGKKQLPDEVQVSDRQRLGVAHL